MLLKYDEVDKEQDEETVDQFEQELTDMAFEIFEKVIKIKRDQMRYDEAK